MRSDSTEIPITRPAFSLLCPFAALPFRCSALSLLTMLSAPVLDALNALRAAITAPDAAPGAPGGDAAPGYPAPRVERVGHPYFSSVCCQNCAQPFDEDRHKQVVGCEGGHLLCQVCRYERIEYDQGTIPSCPVCRAPALPGRRIHIRLEDYDKDVLCDNGCGYLGPRSDMARHQAELCPKTPHCQCPDCPYIGTRENLKAHQANPLKLCGAFKKLEEKTIEQTQQTRRTVAEWSEGFERRVRQMVDDEAEKLNQALEGNAAEIATRDDAQDRRLEELQAKADAQEQRLEELHAKTQQLEDERRASDEANAALQKRIDENFRLHAQAFNDQHAFNAQWIGHMNAFVRMAASMQHLSSPPTMAPPAPPLPPVVGTEPFADAYTDADTGANADDTGSGANANTGSDSNADADTGSDANPNTGSDANADADTGFDANPNTGSDANADADTGFDANANTGSDANADADQMAEAAPSRRRSASRAGFAGPRSSRPRRPHAVLCMQRMQETVNASMVAEAIEILDETD